MFKRANLPWSVGAVALALAAFFPAPPASAQDASPTSTSGLLQGLSLDAGYLRQFSNGSDDALYYRLEYRGKELKAKGVPAKEANLQTPTRVKPLVGGVSSLFFKLDRGSPKLDGGLFDSLGLAPINFGKTRLRGTAEISGRLDARQVNFAFGVETPEDTIRKALGIDKVLRKHFITNWIVVGAAGERRERDGSLGGDEDVALVTYRAFFGRADATVISEARIRTADMMEADIRKLLADYLALPDPNATNDPAEKERRKKLRDAFVAGLEANPTRAGDRFRLLLLDDQVPNILDRFSDEKIKGIVKNYRTQKDRPSVALYLENSGWWTITDPTAGRRFNNLFAATATYWMNPASDKPTFLRLRYENGRERGAPTVKKNMLLMTVGMYF